MGTCRPPMRSCAQSPLAAGSPARPGRRPARPHPGPSSPCRTRPQSHSASRPKARRPGPEPPQAAQERACHAPAIQQLLVKARGGALHGRGDLLDVVAQLHQLVVRPDLELRDGEPAGTGGQGAFRAGSDPFAAPRRSRSTPTRMQREAAAAWLAHSVTLATESSLPRAAVPCESGCFFGTATIRGADIVGPPLRELRRALSASALGPSQKVPDKNINR